MMPAGERSSGMHAELWRPSAGRMASTFIFDFMQKTGVGISSGVPDYDELWKFSVNDPERFWSAVWKHCGIVGKRGPAAVLPSADIRQIVFFPGAEVNYAENLLQRSGAEEALIFYSEDGKRRSLTWSGLRSLVANLQSAMKADGIRPGDRVAGILPNSPEAIAAMLATAGLGAVWSSCSPDFGVSGVLDRFGQIEPKLIFCSDGYYYNGSWHETLSRAAEVAAQVSSVKRLVVAPYAGGDVPADKLSGASVSLSHYAGKREAEDLEFARVPFDAPLFILFSSGTTGLPKCMVHSVGGTLLQHVKEHRLQCDIGPGDRLMYFTTCGWMMWNWMASAMASGASLVMYDGFPMHPDGSRLATIVDSERVTHFGASAKYFDACLKSRVAPRESVSLDQLRTVFSTGSPLSPEAFDYIYDKWKGDVCLSSIAGGTDIIGCFVGGSPVSPVYRGQCQKRLLGMDVRVFDESGREIEEEPGELVCISAHPSMPTKFYNDEDGRKYNDAYFARFPGVWHHGDWVELTAEGGMVFYGRSDATLNPGGVRIGTSEIYRPVELIDEVLEALVIGRDRGSDVELVLFVKLREGVSMAEALEGRIKASIRKNASPRHVPAKVLAVPDIPRTKSGKIVELAVRNVVNGRPVKNVHALANPEALDHFRNLPELAD